VRGEKNVLVAPDVALHPFSPPHFFEWITGMDRHENTLDKMVPERFS
tara:strand:- start:5 stop:145 length:141 start_codon:yes stop_codon:yes gene_type:complete